MIRFVLLFLFVYFIKFDFCEAQVNKKGITNSYANYYLKLINRNYEFQDLRKSKDSIFIRVCPSTFGMFRNFYELKLDSGKQSFRLLIIDTTGTKFDICMKPKTSWTRIENKISEIDILTLKNQGEIDSAYLDGMLDGTQYFIEIATPDTYKFIFWSNPEFAPVKSQEVKRIYSFLDLIEKEFTPCSKKEERKLRKHFY